jgi:hypothetical protein
MSQHPITLSTALFADGKRVAPMNIISSLLDDTKARDVSLKFTQNAFKLAALNTDDKERVGDFNKASGVVGMARRLIRFGRWVPFATNLTKNIFATDPLMIGIKAVHHIACIVGCLCEDITTLDKLKVTRFDVTNFENMQKYATFTEACSGLVLTTLNIKQQQRELRAQLQALKNDPNRDKKDVYKAYVTLHVTTMNAIKWFCEIVAQSFGLDYHSQQQLAVIAAMMSSSNGLYCHALRYLQAELAK